MQLQKLTEDAARERQEALKKGLVEENDLYQYNQARVFWQHRQNVLTALARQKEQFNQECRQYEIERQERLQKQAAIQPNASQAAQELRAYQRWQQAQENIRQELAKRAQEAEQAKTPEALPREDYRTDPFFTQKCGLAMFVHETTVKAPEEHQQSQLFETLAAEQEERLSNDAAAQEVALTRLATLQTETERTENNPWVEQPDPDQAYRASAAAVLDQAESTGYEIDMSHADELAVRHMQAYDFEPQQIDQALRENSPQCVGEEQQEMVQESFTHARDEQSLALKQVQDQQQAEASIQQEQAAVQEVKAQAEPEQGLQEQQAPGREPEQQQTPSEQIQEHQQAQPQEKDQETKAEIRNVPDQSPGQGATAARPDTEQQAGAGRNKEQDRTLGQSQLPQERVSDRLPEREEVEQKQLSDRLPERTVAQPEQKIADRLPEKQEIQTMRVSDRLPDQIEQPPPQQASDRLPERHEETTTDYRPSERLPERVEHSQAPHQAAHAHEQQQVAPAAAPPPQQQGLGATR